MTIKRLRLKNFRLHEDNEITFDDASQLTLLAGDNGSGKSSVLEAIHYAIYAEGRSTKTRLADMVRGGAELEGMTVELDLEHNGHLYSVTRHYEDGMSHATLSMDDTVVTQGPREVTQYFAQLFGMDARGFDLAVFAHQKQLTGLTSLSASKRAQTVSRLVRADVLTKARDDARSEMNDTKRLLKNLGDLPDVDALKAARDNRKAEYDAAIAAQKDAAAESARLQKELESRSDVQEQFQAANSNKARAEGQLSAAKTSQAAAETELSAAEAAMTDRPDVPTEDIEALEEQLDEVGTRLSAAREAAAAEKDRRVLNQEIEALTGQKTELTTQVSAFRGNVNSTSAVVRAEQELRTFRREREEIITEGQDTHVKAAVVKAQLADAEADVTRLGGLDAVCPTCEQGIADEHRDTQVEAAKERVKDLTNQLTELNDSLSELAAARDAKLADIKAAEVAVDEAKAKESEVAAAEKQLAQVERTLSMHTRRINALPPAGDPVEPIAKERAEVAAKVQAVRNAERAIREWDRKENARVSAETTLTKAKLAVEKAEDRVTSAEVPQDLIDAVDELGVIASRLAAERDLTSECTTLAAVAEQRVKAAETEVEAAEKEGARRSTLVDKTERYEAAARLLNASARHMTMQIRPALEGAVGSMLNAMTEGRYDAVSIDRDYNIKVRTDSGDRPLAEMSGGEQDLVALALRLGLARIVSATHGASSPGFLVLDEVFGSQDVRRRETILEALKSLRKVFPQILLVSHVGGTEDQVNEVIRFEIINGDEDSDTKASSLVTRE